MAASAGADASAYTLSPHLQADFYAKLQQLQDEVLTGKHPRYPISQETIELFRAHLIPSPPQQQPKTSLHNGVASVAPAPKPVPQLKSQTHAQYAARPPVKSIPFGSRPSKSFIDPVLLTKSDDLVRAENKLKRQRIERELKTAVDEQGMGQRDAFGPYETSHLFDVDKILEAARVIVKPVSGILDPLPTNRKSPDRSSADENSYYSSRANSWASEEKEKNKTRDDGAVVLHDAASVNVQKKPSVQYQNGNFRHVQTNIDQPMPDAVETSQGQAEELKRLEDHSPPTAYLSQTTDAESIHAPAKTAKRYNQSQSMLYSPPEPRSPSAPKAITPSIAPLLTPLSPLLTANPASLTTQRNNKASSSKQPRGEGGPGRGRSKNTWQQKRDRSKNGAELDTTNSPSTAVPRLQNPRKRPREADKAETGRKGKRVVRSPMLQIKAEPLSPTSNFASLPADAPKRLVYLEDGSIAVELYPLKKQHAPHDTRNSDVSRNATEQPHTYELRTRRLESVPHHASPLGHQHVGRDNMDLRRLASVQHASRPESPPRRMVSIPVDDLRYSRAPSQALMERPLSRPVQYVEAPYRVQESYGSSHPRFDEHLVSMPGPRMSMPPPPPPKRKIIIDEDGVEWLAIAREPPPIYEPRVYYREPSREAAQRAPSHFIERQPALAHPHVIDLEDDTESDHMFAPPILARSMQRRPSQMRQSMGPRYIEVPESSSRYVEIAEPRTRYIEVVDDARFMPHDVRQPSRAPSIAHSQPSGYYMQPPPGSWQPIAGPSQPRGPPTREYERVYSARQ